MLPPVPERLPQTDESHNQQQQQQQQGSTSASTSSGNAAAGPSVPKKEEDEGNVVSGNGLKSEENGKVSFRHWRFHVSMRSFEV